MRLDSLRSGAASRTCFVDLGHQYVAECSANQAEAILTRSRHSLGYPLRHGIDENDLLATEPSERTSISEEADARQESGATVQDMRLPSADGKELSDETPPNNALGDSQEGVDI